MNSESFMPFARPFISEAAIAEVVDCLRSEWITTGPRVKKFETMLAEYFQTPHALALSTATAGLHLALLGLNLQSDDEVIVPALTFVASLNTIVIAGGKPVVVDIDPKTYNIDVNKIAKAITPKTRAIMPVHLTGLAADLDPIYELAQKYNLRIIEDAAQAVGTYYKGRLLGSFGDTQVFSFHPNKNMTTGEGGCVTTNDSALAKAISVMRFHGIDRDSFNRFSKEGQLHYDVIAPGFKYNMTDLQAALGIHQLAELTQFNQKREQIARRYHKLLGDWSEWTLPPHPDEVTGHSWHLFAPLLNTDQIKITRDHFIERMKQEFNIGIGLHYDCPHLFSYYQKVWNYKLGDFPVAEDVSQRIMSLPMHPQLTESDQDRVINAMKTIFNRGNK